MADYDLFQIEISRNYTMSEWREDIKRVRSIAYSDVCKDVYMFVQLYLHILGL